jgi:hypothetical protein
MSEFLLELTRNLAIDFHSSEERLTGGVTTRSRGTAVRPSEIPIVTLPIRVVAVRNDVPGE